MCWLWMLCLHFPDERGSPGHSHIPWGGDTKSSPRRGTVGRHSTEPAGLTLKRPLSMLGVWPEVNGQHSALYASSQERPDDHCSVVRGAPQAWHCCSPEEHRVKSISFQPHPVFEDEPHIKAPAQASACPAWPRHSLLPGPGGRLRTLGGPALRRHLPPAHLDPRAQPSWPRLPGVSVKRGNIL